MSRTKTFALASLLGVLLAVACASMFLAMLGLHASKVASGVLGAETWDSTTGVWSPAGALGERLVAPDLVSLAGGGVLVVGGAWEGLPGVEAFAWDPVARTFADAWSPEIETDCRVALPLTDGRILFSTPSEESPWGIGVYHAELWDPRTQKSARVAMDPDRGVRTTALLAGNRVLFVFASSAAVWDSGTLTWASPPPATSPHDVLDCAASAHALSLPDGRVLVVSRVRASTTAWAWIWDPATSVLVRAAAFEAAIAAADRTHLDQDSVLDALVLSPAGRVVLIGTTHVYVAAADLASARAVALPEWPDGGVTAVVGRRVLVAGGAKDGKATSAAVTLDLDTGAVARTGSMTAARSDASALTLAGGRVLVVGGSREVWDVTWDRFAVLIAFGLGALGLLDALRRLARRSARGWLVVGAAVLGCVLVGGAEALMITFAIGSAISG